MDKLRLMNQARKAMGLRKKLESELSNLRIVGTSGGGLVRCTFDALSVCQGVELDKALLGGNTKASTIEDLIKEAVNQGLKQVRETKESKEQEMALEAMKDLDLGALKNAMDGFMPKK